MNSTRLEGFSDGVIAIIIAIMVLELKVPHGDTHGARVAISLRPTLIPSDYTMPLARNVSISAADRPRRSASTSPVCAPRGGGAER